MDNRYRLNNNSDRFYTGLILILIGAAIFMKRMGVDLPEWLYHWSAIIVLIGLTSGMKAGFKGVSWIIITGIGLVLMSGNISGEVEFKKFLWPTLFIGIGVLFLFRPKGSTISKPDSWQQENSEQLITIQPKSEDGGNAHHYDDHLDCTAVFGGITRTITSKNFKGGEVVCFMGGAQISLGQADIQGPVMLEMTVVFGGAKLVVPPNWEVKSEGVAVFGGLEDKRILPPGSQFDPNKVLVITGTSVFGGIEIKSY